MDELAPPSKLLAYTGVVHWRRLRWWAGTLYEERAMVGDREQTLCGRERPYIVGPAPAGAPVTCGVCIKSANGTRAHLRGITPLSVLNHKGATCERS